MNPLLPNTYVLNNKYLQSILSPSPDIIDYNFTSDQIHKLNLLQILRPDIYFNKKLKRGLYMWCPNLAGLIITVNSLT